MKSIHSQVFWLLSFACVAAFAANAQERLTLREAVALGLRQSPEAAVAQAAVEESDAGLAAAKTALLPQLQFSEEISRGNDPVYAFGTRLRQQRFTQADFALTALNTPDAIGNFATRVSGGWQLFDSLRSVRQIQGARLTSKSAQAQASAVDQKIIFAVVTAYQQALYAEREVETARHEVETAEVLLKSASDHVNAGLAVESDRMSAEANLAACKQGLIAAEGDRQLAWAGLRMAMGAPDWKAAALAPLEKRDFVAGDMEEEVAAALKNREDLNAFRQADRAQDSAVSAARLGLGPHVNAYGNWENDAASFGGANGGNWVAGVQVGIDLLPFGKRSQLAKEKAVKARTDALLESYRQRVRMEVTQAHVSGETARLSVDTVQAATEQAAEGLRIVKNRYDAGLATITDFLRAEDAERTSQSNYWRAVYQNSLAHAQLLYATGRLTPEAAEDLQ